MTEPADLSTCAKEPIHIPDAIQPHGLLFGLDRTTGMIAFASENSRMMVGDGDGVPLGGRLADLLCDDSAASLEHALQRADVTSANPLKITPRNNSTVYDAILHATGDYVLVELEPSQRPVLQEFSSFSHQVNQAIRHIQQATTLTEAYQIAAEEIKQLTGFDRVMVYLFDEEWNGVVVAELSEPFMESYLGLYFPASDIPEQARRLYTINWVRQIPERGYRPSRIIYSSQAESQRPIDLSHSTLRSVSPVHLEYLANMGIEASMSVSILKDCQLFGLIACHHATPKSVPYEARSACEFLAQIFSYQVASIKAATDNMLRGELQRISTEVARLIEQNTTVDVVTGYGAEIMALTNASGVAYWKNGEARTYGQTPSAPALNTLITWLQAHRPDRAFVTSKLGRHVQLPENAATLAAGVIALPLAQHGETYMLWFRPEIITTVSWAGNPAKPVEEREGALRLHPRKSFAIWRERVEGRARDWQEPEVAAALDFRYALLARELFNVNLMLSRSNEELDAFTFIASHDLQTPIRGIRNVATFIEDDDQNLSAPSKERLRTIVDQARRMENLLGSLYEYSRVGRVELAMTQVDLNDVVDDVIAALRFSLGSQNVSIKRMADLPRMVCDRVRVGEVFQNLILNGTVYNDRPVKMIEVGVSEQSDEPVFYVKDNGIGIREADQQRIFEVFRRLAGSKERAAGTGMGLTITRRIIERHAGRIWLESREGEGTTFFFTLGTVREADRPVH